MSEPQNTNEAAGGRSDSTAVLGVEPYEQWAIFYHGCHYTHGYVRHGTGPKLYGSEIEARNAICPGPTDKTAYKVVRVLVSITPNEKVSEGENER